MPRSVVVRTLMTVLAILAPASWPETARAQVPNRLYGTVTLDGVPAPVGTPIQAQVAGAPGKICASTTVRALQVSGTTYPYQLDVPDGNAPEECKPGAVLIFLVGGKTAAQSYTLTDLGLFQRLDLTAPGTPNVPASRVSGSPLAPGCTEVTSNFPDGTTPEVIAAAITPTGVLDGIWRFDTLAGVHRGYHPAAPWASDLTAIQRGETIRICTNAPATLNQPS